MKSTLFETAVISGTGLTSIPGLDKPETLEVGTKFGAVELERYFYRDRPLIYLPRHGKQLRLPPHKINYRANLLALKQCGVGRVIAINTVGGINNNAGPGTIVLPDQIIDYTYGREHTFFDEPMENSCGESMHSDFTEPFSPELRDVVVKQSVFLGQFMQSRGVYGCVQGPRLETAAEIEKLRRDGCDIVGMTVMPEAALAREIELHYVSVCVVVNWAAGINSGKIKVTEMNQNLSNTSKNLWTLIFKTVNLL